MPNLDLGDLSEIDLTRPLPWSTARNSAGLQLIAYLGWPDDKNKRREFLATVGAKILQELMSAEPPADYPSALKRKYEAAKAKARNEVFKQQFQAFGGFGAVSSAPSFEALINLIADNAHCCIVAALVLDLVITMDKHHSDIGRGASVNKAIYLIEQCFHGPQIPKNSKDLWAAWSQHKSVAHLCAAFFYWVFRIAHFPKYQPTITARSIFLEELGLLLALARRFQDFATSYKSHGQMAPLLDPARIWTVPVSLTLPPVGITTEPLSGKRLEALRSYRAPMRSV